MTNPVFTTVVCVFSIFGSIFSAVSYFRLPKALVQNDNLLVITMNMSIANAIMQFCSLFSSSIPLPFDQSLINFAISSSIVRIILVRLPLCSTIDMIHNCTTLTYILCNVAISVTLHQKVISIQNKSFSSISQQNRNVHKSLNVPDLTLRSGFHPTQKDDNERGNHMTTNLIIMSWIFPFVLGYIIPSLFPASLWLDSNNGNSSKAKTCGFIQALQEDKEWENVQDEFGGSSTLLGSIFSVTLFYIPFAAVLYCAFVICICNCVLRLVSKRKSRFSQQRQKSHSNTNKLDSAHNQYTEFKQSYHEGSVVDGSLYSSIHEEMDMRRRTDKAILPDGYTNEEERSKKYTSSLMSIGSNQIEVEEVDDIIPSDVTACQYCIFQYILFPSILVICWILEGIMSFSVMNKDSSIISQLGRFEISFVSQLHVVNMAMPMTGILNCLVWILRGPSIWARWNKEYLEVDPSFSNDGFLWSDDLDDDEFSEQII